MNPQQAKREQKELEDYFRKIIEDNNKESFGIHYLKTKEGNIYQVKKTPKEMIIQKINSKKEK